MASTLSVLWHCTLLVLLLAQPTHSSTIQKPKDATAEQKPLPSSSHTYIIQTNHLAKPSQFATLERWYSSMVATHSPRAAMNSSSRLLHTYGTVMHGFAVRLTEEESRRMSSTLGVSGVYRSRMRYTQTTRSPGFMGLHEDFGAWPDSELGDGIIIGFIDSGIWPESASFNDTGLGPVRSTWKGTCVGAEGFNASLCNNKLVGAKVFAAEPGGALTPRDKVGHGTHVSGTAAGSEVRGASLFGFSRGTARGVAPRARIAMYKACEANGCTESSIVAAIDAAVSDGVDVISMSLVSRYENPPFYNDVVAVAMFGAEQRGVFVVLAGGNMGPEASSVGNVAPWMTTVGAATTDRVFPATLKLGNGAVVTGQSLYPVEAQGGTNMVPLVYSSCDKYGMIPDNVTGKVLVCKVERNYVESGIYAQRAGGAGIVGVQSEARFRDAVTARAFTLPGLTLSYIGRTKLDAYMSSVPYPVASFGFSCDTVTGENRAPMVAGFSSRGPNSVVAEIMKPDVVAPGVNILAAWSGDAPPSPAWEDDRRVEYNIVSGTSMACPHVAGAAALIKKRHGDWTPAMVRSALMTTATPLDKNGRRILDNGVGYRSNYGVDDMTCDDATTLAAGAGLVLPRLAMDPGLVYDLGTEDYVDLLCTLNYTTEQMRRFVPGMSGCARTLPGGAGNLNYPSLVAVFDSRTSTRTLTRTVTKVSAQAETYNATVAAPAGVNVTVTPTTLVFRRQNEKKSYSVEFRSNAVKPAGAWEFGHITWENRKHQVRSPVAVLWQN
ncbi:subtilisin-like protease SBT1.7 [Lolium rigidum]|uniref:subtilisin-like protease SBT1.7 n=1 Tax=Lolium rigidum TaxID=89674 RepID=UPI001F5CB837|nr:subtilisin-like protease SBT1.7 [Lolium rigidum]